MDQEFDTILEDGSTMKVCMYIMSLRGPSPAIVVGEITV